MLVEFRDKSKWNNSVALLLLLMQRHMTKTTTPMTAEAFADWKRRKAEAREAEMTAKRAERARTDRMRYAVCIRKFDFSDLLFEFLFGRLII